MVQLVYLSYPLQPGPSNGVKLGSSGDDYKLETTTDGVSVTGKLAVNRPNAVLRMDGLNGAFNHGRYGHTLIQNKNNSTTNWWGLSPVMAAEWILVMETKCLW